MTEAVEIKRVLVIGAGGVGFWMSLALLRDLPATIDLIVVDGDNFEGGNGHRRLPRVANPATRKVDFLSGFAQVTMGLRAPTQVCPEYFEADQIETRGLGPSDLVIDATDMALDRRRPLWAALREAGCQMLRVSYDGNGVVVVARGLPLSGRPDGGYALVPNQAQSFAAAGFGAAAAIRLVKGEQVEDMDYQL